MKSKLLLVPSLYGVIIYAEQCREADQHDADPCIPAAPTVTVRTVRKGHPEA